jgi:hypothetical protein
MSSPVSSRSGRFGGQESIDKMVSLCRLIFLKLSASGQLMDDSQVVDSYLKVLHKSHDSGALAVARPNLKMLNLRCTLHAPSRTEPPCSSDLVVTTLPSLARHSVLDTGMSP